MHTTKHSQANSPLPDYEPLFNENADEVRKKPVKILVRILGANWFKILISCFLKIVKALGIWLLPIITANIIDAATAILGL